MFLPKCATILQRCFPNVPVKRETAHRAFVLVATFVAYTAYHLSRRPLSIVKNVLNQDCSHLEPPPGVLVTNETRHSWCNWEPFNGTDATNLLAVLDSCYLFSYACFMFVSGAVAERVDLRYYLSFGMLLSGIFTYLFGLAYTLDIHWLAYFIVIQILTGAAQSTGWPSVVTCIGNWFGKSRRGFIFGVWNAHLYVGNILGAYVAGVFVETNWGLSFMIPGLIIGLLGFFIFLFLAPKPEDVNCSPPNQHEVTNTSFSSSQSFRSDYDEPNEETYLLNLPLRESKWRESKSKKAITLWGAVKIPGVIEFSLCLFFAKLVSYTFLFWLPRYIDQSTTLGSQGSAYMSIPFDIGGIIGGIVAGLVSDGTGASAITCSIFLAMAIPSLVIFNTFAKAHVVISIFLQLVCGALVNGPYALITTAISAELGTHPSITGSAKALSTVTAIIDGTGSLGAAAGPLIAGLVSQTGWSSMFYMMMLSDFLGLVVLCRIVYKEAARLRTKTVSLPTV